MTPLTTQSISEPTERQPLRRAVYVHISDLISVYNIDHVQLELEIARVNAKRSNVVRTSGADVATTTSSDTIETGKTQKPSNVTSDSSKDGSSSAPAPDQGADLVERHVVPQKRLQPPRGGFNLCVLVGNINLVVDKRRVDQSRVRLAEVEIGDETGTVCLRARDEQIDLLEKVRNKGIPRAVVLRNCTLELYQGKHIRLAVTKWGKLTEYPDNVASTPGPPPTMNLDRNFSLIDLSLVASEIIAEKKQPDALPHASVTTALTGSIQTKKAEVKTNKPASSSTKPSAPPSKQGQSNVKQQQQQQQPSRRTSQSSTNEQRRQSRSSQYSGMQVDTTQPSRSDQMMYHGIPGYHGYGEQSMDMHMRQQYPPHSPYAHSHMHSQSSRQQDAVSAQYALHQQYEMQQRQLHQLYTREQNREVGQVQQQQQQQQQPSPMYLRHMTSFDTSTGSYTGDISMSSEIGSSQSMVPPPDHYSQSPKMENYQGLQQDVTHSTAAYASMEAMSQYRVGKMNPEASSFAPSYLSAAQGSRNQQQMTTMAIPGPPQYPAYNISQQQQQQQQPLPGASMYPTLQSAHHPQFYVQAAISSAAYHHTMPQGSFNTSLERDPDVKTESTATTSTTSRSYHHYQQYPPNAPPMKVSAPSAGKENVTSKP